MPARLPSPRSHVAPRTAVIALVLLPLLLAACGGDETAETSDTAAATAEREPSPAATTMAPTTVSEGQGGAYPLVFENCGFELTFEQRPERVLILNGSGYTESTTFAALGLEDTVLANAQLPLGFSEQEGLAETVAALPDGGLEVDPTVFEVQREAILAARPDLVVSIWSGGFSEFGSNITRDELHDLGINTYVSRPYCDYGTADQTPPALGLDASWQLIEDLGVIFDVQEEAEALIAEQQATIDEVTDAVEGAEPVRIAMLNPSSLWASFAANGIAGIGTFPVQNALIEAAGGVNAFADANASREQMVATDVDVLVIQMTDPTTTPEQMAQIVFDAFPEWDASVNRTWTCISDGAYFGPTQHLAIEKMARVAHPDRFGE